MGLALGQGGLVFFTTSCCLMAVDSSQSQPAAGPAWQYTLRAPVPSLTLAADDTVVVETVDSVGSKVYVTGLAGPTGYLLWSTLVANGTALGAVVVGPTQTLVAAVGNSLVAVQRTWCGCCDVM